ncbi:MAG: hypothetical protein JWR37_3035 [Mycobacterium sp.]|nr:hypothetical protein [Mycobacterium sp.]
MAASLQRALEAITLDVCEECFADLHHFVLIYDCPAGTAVAREFPDHTSAAIAYQELDPDSFGGLLDVTLVSCESDVTLERLAACPVTLHTAASSVAGATDARRRALGEAA